MLPVVVLASVVGGSGVLGVVGSAVVGFGVVVGSDVAVSVVGFAVIIKKNYNYNFFSTLLSLAGNSGRLTRESTTAARAALPIPINVCRIFVCPNNDGAASARDF